MKHCGYTTETAKPNQNYHSLDVISCTQDDQKKSEKAVIQLLSKCTVLRDLPVSILHTIAIYLPLQMHLIPYHVHTYSFDILMVADCVLFAVHICILATIVLMMLFITTAHIEHVIIVTASIALYECITIIGCHSYYSSKPLYLNVDDERTPQELIHSGFALFYETFRDICAVNRIIVFSWLLYLVLYVQFPSTLSFISWFIYGDIIICSVRYLLEFVILFVIKYRNSRVARQNAHSLTDVFVSKQLLINGFLFPWIFVIYAMITGSIYLSLVTPICLFGYLFLFNLCFSTQESINIFNVNWITFLDFMILSVHNGSYFVFSALLYDVNYTVLSILFLMLSALETVIIFIVYGLNTIHVWFKHEQYNLCSSSRYSYFEIPKYHKFYSLVYGVINALVNVPCTIMLMYSILMYQDIPHSIATYYVAIEIGLLCYVVITIAFRKCVKCCYTNSGGTDHWMCFMFN
eukprot:543009_1